MPSPSGPPGDCPIGRAPCLWGRHGREAFEASVVVAAPSPPPMYHSLTAATVTRRIMPGNGGRHGRAWPGRARLQGRTTAGMSRSTARGWGLPPCRQRAGGLAKPVSSPGHSRLEANVHQRHWTGCNSQPNDPCRRGHKHAVVAGPCPRFLAPVVESDPIGCRRLVGQPGPRADGSG